MSHNEIAIRVENLTKVYKLYNKPIDRMKEALNPFRKSYHNDFYALNDVNFEIKKGECVGILGKNGAGKSTLLKIITGVLTPTSGSVTVNGRVSALLELGAGFNPEYTGLENIYFQGNLMGFERAEMEQRIDDILKFADIGEFIHQPVKSYSSGMFARLAFAVAINVEPDILIVDEALSVGDMAFQSKCMRKMISIMEDGATVVFVSHDIQAIKKFCNRAIWMRDGSKYRDADTESVAKSYMSFSAYGLDTHHDEDTSQHAVTCQKKDDVLAQDSMIDMSGLECFGEFKGKILRVAFTDCHNQPVAMLVQRERYYFVCDFIATQKLYDIGIGVLFKNKHNTDVITFNSYMYGSPLDVADEGRVYRAKVEFVVPKIHPSEYAVTVALSTGTQMTHEQQHYIHTATTVNVVSCDMIDGCIITLAQDEVSYKYEQI